MPLPTIRTGTTSCPYTSASAADRGRQTMEDRVVREYTKNGDGLSPWRKPLSRLCVHPTTRPFCLGPPDKRSDLEIET